MKKYQLLTISQLAEFIASELNYTQIWKSNFPDCDFCVADVVEMKQYSFKELEEMSRDASGWCGIKKVANLFDSTTLYAFADHYGGGCDSIARLYDGIGVLEAEIVLQDVIRSTLEATEAVTDDTFLLVEFPDAHAQDTAQEAEENKTIQTLLQQGV